MEDSSNQNNPSLKSIKNKTETRSEATSDLKETTTSEISELDRMRDFFRGYTDEDSRIIMSGYCPECHKKGIDWMWVLLMFGTKECTRCGWKDY